MAVGLTVIQFFRPSRTNPAELTDRAIQSHVPWQPEVSAVFERACRDCHSNRTVWPWYSNVAPVSWFVAGHVNQARSHLNVSEWSGYDSLERAAFLNKMCDFVRTGRMPLASYTWIHRNAVLAEMDVDVLCSWTQQAVEELQAENR